MIRARSPSASTSLSMTTSPTFSHPWQLVVGEFGRPVTITGWRTSTG
jgi:hypothetical protein